MTTSFVEGWLASESASHDSISVKRAYIDINGGNIHDGLIFSQIMYWHGRNTETGKPRLKVFKEGHYWLAKTYDDWWEECRIVPRTAKACITRIKNRGLITTKIFKFNGMPTVHIRLDWAAFEEAIRHLMSKPLDIECPNDQTSNVRSLTETTGIDSQQINNEYKHEYKQANSARAESASDSFSDFELAIEPVTEGKQRLTTRPVNQTQTGKASSSSKKTTYAAAASLSSNNQDTDNLVAIRVPQRTEQNPIEFEVNDVGWLRMPRTKQYELARWLTTRRLCYQLAMMWSNFDFAKDDNGHNICEGNQIAIKCDERVRLENEWFNEGGLYPLLNARDELLERNKLSQDEFNAILQTLFLDSVRWLKEKGANAKKTLNKQSPAYLFFNDDRKLVEQIRQEHRQQST